MKQYRAILITWFFLTLFLSMPMMGPMIFLSTIVVFFFLIIQLTKVFMKKLCWKQIFNKFIIILVSYLIVGTVHYVRLEHNKIAAQNVVKQVLAYKSTYNKYPLVSELKIENKDIFSGKINYIYYEDEKDITNKQTTPSLFYLDTFMMFASYHYNFKENIWEYDAD